MNDSLSGIFHQDQTKGRQMNHNKIEQLCAGGAEIGRHVCVVQTAMLRTFQAKQACTSLLLNQVVHSSSCVYCTQA